MSWTTRPTPTGGIGESKYRGAGDSGRTRADLIITAATADVAIEGDAAQHGGRRAQHGARYPRHEGNAPPNRAKRIPSWAKVVPIRGRFPPNPTRDSPNGGRIAPIGGSVPPNRARRLRSWGKVALCARGCLDRGGAKGREAHETRRSKPLSAVTVFASLRVSRSSLFFVASCSAPPATRRTPPYARFAVCACCRGGFEL
jgi:hypothetical protein